LTATEARSIDATARWPAGAPHRRGRPRPDAGERVRLARDGLLAGVTFAMGALLTLVFPSARDFDRSTAALPVGAYSTAYLEVLVKANPRNWTARLAFVRQLQGRGDFARALSELDVVPRTDENRAELEALALDIAWAAVKALPTSVPMRAQAVANVVGRLESLAREPVSAARAEVYADIALQVERPLLAAELYRRVGDASQGEARARALAVAGRWALAGGDPGRAAELYDGACRATARPDGQAIWARQSLVAGEATGDAAFAADRALGLVAMLPDDPGLMSEAARLALAAQRPVVARDLGRQLLRAAPSDIAERERQALRELAAGDPGAAWPLIEEAVHRHPTSAAWREREADTAEWTGRPQIALRDWLWLSRTPGRQAGDRSRPGP
jgi:tetratricopeptide (TPR) repeat protein